MLVLFKRLYGKRAVALAAAGAVALGVGMAATPNEAAAQCALDVDGTDVVDINGLNSALSGSGTATVDVDCTDSITTGDIVDGTITGDDIDSETITGANVDDGTLTGDDIQDGSIGADDLGTDSVNTDEIATGAVTTDEILNGTIQTEDLADDSVTWGKLSSGVRNRIDENTEGVAIALALQNPDLVGNESFGLSVNWGGFDNANALGVAATGVLGRDVFGAGDRLSIAGGVGIGMDDDTVGGRVGAQLSW